MTKVLFICHGNICRSTLAQFYFQHLVDEAGLQDEFVVDSAATSTEEIGCDVDPRTRRVLNEHNVPCGHHASRQVTKEEYDDWDYIITMDMQNLRWLGRIISSDPDSKISLLMSHTPSSREIEDPWYTHDFETAYDDISYGCDCLFEKLTK